MTQINTLNPTISKLSTFPLHEGYSFSLCGLTLFITKQSNLPIQTTSSDIVLSLDSVQNHHVLNSSIANLNSPIANNAKIITFQFVKEDKNIDDSHYFNENQSFILHAPSVLALWALAVQKETPSLIEDILPKPNFSHSFLVYLKFILCFERFRLGSDVESLFMKKILYREGIGKEIPPIAIKQWLRWLDIIKKLK